MVQKIDFKYVNIYSFIIIMYISIFTDFNFQQIKFPTFLQNKLKDQLLTLLTRERIFYCGGQCFYLEYFLCWLTWKECDQCRLCWQGLCFSPPVHHRRK